MVKSSRGISRIIQHVAGFFTAPASQSVTSGQVNYKAPATVATLSTGLRQLDKALGIDGLPYGGIIELMGPDMTPNSGGAISIAARIAARAQRQQRIVTIIDMSHNFDLWQAERCGLIAPHLLLARPHTVFDALTMLENAARNADLVIVVMGLVTELLRQVEADLRLILLRRLHHIVRGAETVFLFVTTPYQNNPFDPNNYPPGFPLSDIAAIRLWVQAESWSHKEGLVATYKANLAVIKNELATPGAGAEIRIKLNAA
jgi:hypothetical protein